MQQGQKTGVGVVLLYIVGCLVVLGVMWAIAAHIL